MDRGRIDRLASFLDRTVGVFIIKSALYGLIVLAVLAALWAIYMYAQHPFIAFFSLFF